MNSLDKVKLQQRHDGGFTLTYFCPGCKCRHTINYGDGKPPNWTFKNNEKGICIYPSILVQSIRQDMTEAEELEYDKVFEEKGQEAVFNDPRFGIRCHCFITDSQISFLDDCTHSLRGQVVPLLDYQ